MQKEFIDFINEHHVLSISACKDNTSWCANCFYVLYEDGGSLVIASGKGTKHISMMIENPKISGTIVLETKEVGLLQGLQFSGTIEEASSEAKKVYFKRYPYALAMLPQLWEVKIEYGKLTNNRLGFGKKLEFKL